MEIDAKLGFFPSVVMEIVIAQMDDVTKAIVFVILDTVDLGVTNLTKLGVKLELTVVIVANARRELAGVTHHTMDSTVAKL